jgi:hypothetical protein
MLMENLLNFFSENFEYFCKVYTKPEYEVRSVVSLDVESTEYIDSKIGNDIKLKLKKYIKVQFDTKTNLTIYFSESKPYYYLEFIIFYTKWILYILQKMKGSQPELSIQVFLTGFKKRFPRKRVLLTPYNVNSGVTYYYKSSKHRNVVIFRDEELLKVMMHEMIHAYNLDNVDMAESLETNIKEYFGIKNKIHLNESYTDTVACIYNVICFSLIWSRLKGKRLRQVLNMFLDRERRYIMMKARDVLLHMGYKFDKTGIKEVVSREETTHVISYYILKAVNFCYINEFIKFLVPKNIDLGDDMGYGKLLNKNLRQGKFWEILCENKDIHSSSLRMSEIDIKYLLINAKEKLLKTLLS